MTTKFSAEKLLFKDYLNVPSNRPTAEWFDEGDSYNNYIIGNDVFADAVPDDPTFTDISTPAKYNGLEMSKYYIDSTGVLENFEKLVLKVVPKRTALVNGSLRNVVFYQTDTAGENILKNAFQFNYGTNREFPKFNYILYINGTELSKGTRWLFNYKSGYITFYSDEPLENDVVSFTFVRYKGRIGLSNIQSDITSSITTVQQNVDGKLNLTGGELTNTLTITKKADGAELLKLNTDRAWSFKQRSTGSGAGLDLQSEVGNKFFRIVGSAGDIMTELYAHQSAPNSGITTINTAGNISASQFTEDGTALINKYAPKTKPIPTVEILPETTDGYSEGDTIIVSSTNIIYRVSESQWVPISGGNAVNKTITSNSFQFFRKFTTSGTIGTFLNTQGVGLDGNNDTTNNHLYNYKSQTITGLKITATNLISDTEYDISLSIVGGQTYSENVNLSVNDDGSMPYYTIVPPSDMEAHFDCQTSYKNLISSTPTLNGGIFTSTDYRVGYGSLMIPMGMTVSVSPMTTWNTNTWTLSFHYKFVSHQNNFGKAFIMYYNNTTSTSSTPAGLCILYDNITHKISFGVKDDLVESSSTINFLNKWATFVIRRSTTSYELRVYENNELKGTITYTKSITWNNAYALNFGTYEAFPSEASAFIDDIRIYSSVVPNVNVSNFGIISQKQCIGQTFIDLTSQNIVIPEKSQISCYVNKKTATDIPEILNLEFTTYKDDLETGEIIKFHKHLYTNNEIIQLNTGLNVEGLYNNETGNIHDLIHPSSKYVYIPKKTVFSHLYINTFKLYNEQTTFDVKIFKKGETDQLLTTKTVIMNPLHENYNYKRYTVRHSTTNLQDYFSCDKTYANAITTSTVKLVGGILTNTDAVIGETSLFIPKGTGAVITQRQYPSIFSVMFWYKHVNFSHAPIIDSGPSSYIIVGFYSINNTGTPTLYLEYDSVQKRIRLCSIASNGAQTSSSYVNIDLTEWTHISITRNTDTYNVYINGTSNISGTFTLSSDDYFTLNFCNWSAGLLKASAYLSDIRIYNNNTTGYSTFTNITNTSTPLSIEKIALDVPLEIDQNNYIRMQINPITPLIQQQQYITIDLIPEIPYNSTFNDSNGILKFKTIEPSRFNYKTYINPSSLSKVNYEIPYNYTHKIKAITNVMIAKLSEIDSVDQSYNYILKYGTIDIVGNNYVPTMVSEYMLDSSIIKSTQIIRSKPVQIKGYNTPPPTDNLEFWFKCNGYRNCNINSTYKLDGGIFTTNDAIIGNQCLTIPRGSSASIHNVDLPNAFTISFLFKNIETTSYDHINIMRIMSNDVSNNLLLSYNTSTSKFGLQVGTSHTTQTTTTNITTNWVYIVIRSTGIAINVSINGTQILTLTVGNIFKSTLKNTIQFGIYEEGNLTTACNISDIRMYKVSLGVLTTFNVSNIINRTRYLNFTEYKFRFPVAIPANSITTIQVINNSYICPFDNTIYSFVYGEDITNDVLFSLLSTKFYAQSGSAEYPTYSFLEQNNTGMYRLTNTNGIGFSVNGEDAMRIDENKNVSIFGSINTQQIQIKSDNINSVYSLLRTIPSSEELVSMLAFTAIGTHSITFSKSGYYDILIVAGGGSGGLKSTFVGGGGGAGGLILLENTFISAGTYSVVVGKGGTAITNGSNSGDNSSFDNNTAIGGGGGGFSGNEIESVGKNGGSGGGGSNGGNGGTGTPNQGFNGGTTNLWYQGGGGGGAGGVGGNNGAYPQNGRDVSNIFGTTYGVNGVFSRGGPGQDNNLDRTVNPIIGSGNGGKGGTTIDTITAHYKSSSGSSGIVIIKPRIPIHSDDINTQNATYHTVVNTIPNLIITGSENYTSSFNVGIGTTNPTHTLTVNGTFNATTTTETSDIRLKRNIMPINSALNKIVNLQGVNYLWNNTELNKHYIYNGFIAQDVKNYIPEVVHGNEEKEMLSISYTGLIPYLVESIKELKKQNDELKEEINSIKQR